MLNFVRATQLSCRGFAPSCPIMGFSRPIFGHMYERHIVGSFLIKRIATTVDLKIGEDALRDRGRAQRMERPDPYCGLMLPISGTQR